ncbi:hypothetical protein AWB79_06573 [Caballeronia hypogeia]|uniref:Uncharacterized protein n=1 Tax=Caballeronia hypogeia TaxID=1777140 RepID=A0A158D711_9BURK|nr:hypothetical protein AWB79_06573 [Caballeronia hypogeia]
MEGSAGPAALQSAARPHARRYDDTADVVEVDPFDPPPASLKLAEDGRVYDESVYLNALRKRGSPLLLHAASNETLGCLPQVT